MPNRYIRDGLLDSELVDQLSAEAERLFVRMMIAADDAGRITGRLDVLRSKCYPLKPSLPLADLEAWLTECEAAGAVLRYQVECKTFIQIAKTQRYGKTVYSKVPWTDGSFRIQFVSRETRDGDKEFVSTSLFATPQAAVSAAPHREGVATPSAPHSDGVGMGSTPHKHPMQAEQTLTLYEYVSTNTRTDSAPSAVSESREPSSANAVSPLQAERTVEEQQLLPSPPAADRTAPIPPPEAGSKASSRAAAGKAKSNSLKQITADAVESFNRAPFTIANGGRCSNVTLVNKVVEREVDRCVSTASAICNRLYGSPAIVAEFWTDYWATVDGDPFHSGRIPGSGDHAGWTPSFEFLTRPKTMTKLFNKAMSGPPCAAPPADRGYRGPTAEEILASC